MHKFIGQSDVKHIMTSFGLAEILGIMSFSTFKFVVILYITVEKKNVG